MKIAPSMTPSISFRFVFFPLQPFHGSQSNIQHIIDIIPVKRALKTSSFIGAFFQHYHVDLCESGAFETVVTDE